jgi:peptidyl-prolyl cis-trans isomerase A (cyclophilin A)
MRSRTCLSLLAVSLPLLVLSVRGARAQEGDPNKGQFTIAEATKGITGPANGVLTATIETNKGKITCELYDKQVPNTVANFVGLATGKRAWLDPKTGKWVQKKPFYNGLTFHRVIPDFMIQGGDPLGNGTGNPGYKFDDEIVADLKFSKPGLLAMANAGKQEGRGTNGSQFFITESMPAYLDGKHTIFGACDPLTVVKDIARVPVGPANRPQQEVVMKKVTIARAKPPKAAAGAAAKPGADKAAAPAAAPAAPAAPPPAPPPPAAPPKATP